MDFGCAADHMTNLNPQLLFRSPFNGCMNARSKGHGVTFSDRDGLAVAMVLARKGQGAALALRMRKHFHIELPQGPQRVTAGDLAAAGTNRGAWLVTCEQGGNEFAEHLSKQIGDLASVSDHSDGYACLRLSGVKVRQTLGKLVSIDVHSRAFQVGDVAITVAAHIGVTLWRLQDRSDGAPVFEITAFRSLAMSLWHALSTSAAEFGYAFDM
jgi:methylglutamate dehydrogenase subunit D